MRTGHEHFEFFVDGYTHKVFQKLDVRRVVREGTDEAQIEVLIAQTPTLGKRTTTICTSVVMNPADAKRFALALCPELHPSEESK